RRRQVRVRMTRAWPQKENCCDRLPVNRLLATPDAASQRPPQCSPGKKESREFGGHKRNKAVGHTGYTEQLPDSLDGKCNTALLVSNRTITTACFAGSCLEPHWVSAALSVDRYPRYFPSRVA